MHVAPAGEGPRLDIQFVSQGRYDHDLQRKDPDGYTYGGLGNDGKVTAMPYEELSDLLDYLLNDDLHAP